MWWRRVALMLACGVVLCLPACLASCQEELTPTHPTQPPVVKYPAEPPEEE